MQWKRILLPMVVALPLFLQNIESTTMATALPTMALSLGVDPLDLKLAITAYLISLAIFLPASGWLADRIGPKRLFCCAIVAFACGSIGCAVSDSLPSLVAARVLQGMGGAMMLPVGRLILLRNVAGPALVAAMVWFTVPPAVGRVVGPVVGGAVVTWLSWRWMFGVSLLASLCALALAWSVIDAEMPSEPAGSFDAIGFGFLGFGLASLLGGLEAAGLKGVHGAVPVALCGAGVLALSGYYVHYRTVASPLIELRIFRYRTLFTAVVSAFPQRMATGAAPFLLPLMFQLGFGLTALEAGLLMMCNALGMLSTRAVMGRMFKRFGFKQVLLAATLWMAASFFLFAMSSPATPRPVLVALMVAGGLGMSVSMVSLQTLAYSEVAKPEMAQATALATMAQQLSTSTGVLFGAELLRIAATWQGRNGDLLVASDFRFALVVLACCTLVSAVIFVRLPRDVGNDLR